MRKSGVAIELINLSTMKTFKKYFETEWERDKFKRKLKYSKKIKIVKEDKNENS